MKPSFAFDTSALISLGHTELINLIIENYNIIISKRILQELKQIDKGSDKDAISAKKWLKFSKVIKLKEAKDSKIGENELFEICQREKIPMVTDDIKATKKFKNKIEWIYSVHVVFLLYYKKIISKERALFSIEKMRAERSWKENLISVTGRILFQ